MDAVQADVILVDQAAVQIVERLADVDKVAALAQRQVGQQVVDGKDAGVVQAGAGLHHVLLHAGDGLNIEHDAGVQLFAQHVDHLLVIGQQAFLAVGVDQRVGAHQDVDVVRLAGHDGLDGGLGGAGDRIGHGGVVDDGLRPDAAVGGVVGVGVAGGIDAHAGGQAVAHKGDGVKIAVGHGAQHGQRHHAVVGVLVILIEGRRHFGGSVPGGVVHLGQQPHRGVAAGAFRGGAFRRGGLRRLGGRGGGRRGGRGLRGLGGGLLRRGLHRRRGLPAAVPPQHAPRHGQQQRQQEQQHAHIPAPAPVLRLFMIGVKIRCHGILPAIAKIPRRAGILMEWNKSIKSKRRQPDGAAGGMYPYYTPAGQESQGQAGGFGQFLHMGALSPLHDPMIPGPPRGPRPAPQAPLRRGVPRHCGGIAPFRRVSRRFGAYPLRPSVSGRWAGRGGNVNFLCRVLHFAAGVVQC